MFIQRIFNVRSIQFSTTISDDLVDQKSPGPAGPTARPSGSSIAVTATHSKVKAWLSWLCSKKHGNLPSAHGSRVYPTLGRYVPWWNQKSPGAKPSWPPWSPREAFSRSRITKFRFLGCAEMAGAAGSFGPIQGYHLSVIFLLYIH